MEPARISGMVVKLRPGDTMTLLDSLQKRLTFLQEVANRIGVDVSLLHQRAEDAGREQGLRMQFDVATARAVAPLYRLCEYCLPFVKMGGIFVAMKGPKGEEELGGAQSYPCAGGRCEGLRLSVGRR
ncbi:MAG: 16S rRNA (guanine(527)-N(7))-methyltransferase RsmG [[Clostridium] leptum]